MSQATTDRQLVTLVLVILAVLLLVPLLVGFGMMGFGPMMGGMGGGGMWGGGMWDAGTPGWRVLLAVLVQLVFLAVIVGLGYLVYRAVTRSQTGADPAMQELRLAYARGDLSDDEYERRRDELRRDS